MTPRQRTALLINPFYPKDPHASFGKHVLTPTLTLTSIAAATPDDWHVEYWDENLLQGPPPSEPFPQVVGITVHLTFARRAYELADWYRRRGAIVVLGGLHVMSAPEEVRPHADILAFGEGVKIWPEILRDVQAGTQKAEYVGAFDSSFELEPAPRHSLAGSRDFLTRASVIATRGCHSRCGFCYLSTRGLRMPYQVRPPRDVAREIAETGEPYAVFIDNNLGSRPEYLRELCRELETLRIIWSAAVSIDTANDPSVVAAMAASGCTGVFVGFETLDDSNLRDARKKTPPTQDFARRVRIFHDHGIQVNGSFVFGFDHDGPDVFERTVAWIEENRLECATYHILTPYPGTPLFREMERAGRLLHKDWGRYDTSHAVFRPARMSPEELEEGYSWAYRRTFSWDSIWARRPERWSSVPGYLGMSALYKKSNWLWPWLIQWRLTHAAWRPLVNASRWVNVLGRGARMERAAALMNRGDARRYG